MLLKLSYHEPWRGGGYSVILRIWVLKLGHQDLIYPKVVKLIPYLWQSADKIPHNLLEYSSILFFIASLDSRLCSKLSAIFLTLKKYGIELLAQRKSLDQIFGYKI